MKIRPPLLACIGFSARLFGFLILFMAALGLIVDLVKGRAPLAWMLNSPLELAAVFGGLIVALGLVLFLVSLFCACSVETAALKGRNFWGLRKSIAWGDVGQIERVTVEGVPALVVGSASSSAEVYVYLLGVDRSEIHAALRKHAGPHHVLTRLFAPI